MPLRPVFQNQPDLSGRSNTRHRLILTVSVTICVLSVVAIIVFVVALTVGSSVKSDLTTATASASTGGSPSTDATGPTGANTLPLAGKVVLVDPGHNGGNGAH